MYIFYETLLNVFLNLIIRGIDLDKNPIDIRKKIGVVPQELNIDPFLRLMSC